MLDDRVPQPPRVLATATSDDSGRYKAELPAESPEVVWRRTRLIVWAYHPAHSVISRLLDRDWPAAGLPLSLQLNRATAMRIKLSDHGWRPLPHARVEPHNIAGHILPDEVARRMALEADDAGNVTIACVLPGQLWSLRVTGPICGTQWVDVSKAGESVTIVRTAPVGRLSGRLTAENIRAVGRRTLRFATWRMPGDEDAGGGLAEVVTDAAGNFDVPVIAAGSLAFELKEDGRLDTSPQNVTTKEDGPPGPSPTNVTAPEGHSPETPVFLTAQYTGPQVDAGETTRFEIPLRRAVAITQEVRDRDDDSPIAKVRVSMKWGIPGGASGDTDAAGRFTTLMLPGNATVMPIRIPRQYYFPQANYRGQAIADGADKLTLKTVRLARGFAVSGRVVDENRRPVAGAEIVGFWPLPTNADIPLHSWSNAAGEFTIDGVASGAGVRLWAGHGEAVNVAPIVARTGAEPVEIVIRAKPSVSLEGRVLDAKGKPFAGAQVRVWAEQRQHITGRESLPLGAPLFAGSEWLTTDADGCFQTPRSLRPNVEYLLDVLAPGMSRVATETIEPATWKTTRFADIVLRAAPRLRAVLGQVVDGEGRPVADARVWQSGDGPSRTETRTDASGRFQLPGVFDEPALLFVLKDSFRLRCVRVAPAVKDCQVTLHGANEPAVPRSTLPLNLPPPERRKLGMSLVEPLLPIIHHRVFDGPHVELLNIIAQGDPEQALEISEKVLTNPQFITQARRGAALSMIETDFDEGLAVIATLHTANDRALAYLQAWDALTGLAPERKDGLLDEALVQARAESDVGNKVYLMGRIADRWLDLGRRERATALLREGQALAEQLPAPSETTQRETAVHNRGNFAGALARVDGPAALALIEGFEEPYRDWYLANVARGLAEHDPAEAERLFQRLEHDSLRFLYGLAVVHRMATADVQRAARLAASYAEEGERAYALGMVAHGLATGAREAALGYLLEAFEILERAHSLGQDGGDREALAVKAAALLPVAERIAPERLEELLWRALALRPPRSARGDQDWQDERSTAALATLVARYDRELARDLLEPLSHRLREAFAEAESHRWQIAKPLLKALAATDALWAAQLVQALPDYQVEATKNPKQVAARLLAETLVASPYDFWQQVYSYNSLRDPDGSDEVP
ncbi:MAG TPA: hypothetical protein VF278_02360 [Pirellulales bacterium]